MAFTCIRYQLKPSSSKHLQMYMQRVFERDAFLASLTELEREMRLSARG